MNEFDRLTDLKIDEWIWIFFIILSLMNIFGDELEKDYCFRHDQEEKYFAHKIFTLTVFISLLIYLYLAYRRYKVFKMNRDNCGDIRICGTRFFASILVVIAASMYLYCQIHDPSVQNPSIV